MEGWVREEPEWYRPRNADSLPALQAFSQAGRIRHNWITDVSVLPLLFLREAGSMQHGDCWLERAHTSPSPTSGQLPCSEQSSHASFPVRISMVYTRSGADGQGPALHVLKHP